MYCVLLHPQAPHVSGAGRRSHLSHTQHLFGYTPSTCLSHAFRSRLSHQQPPRPLQTSVKQLGWLHLPPGSMSGVHMCSQQRRCTYAVQHPWAAEAVQTWECSSFGVHPTEAVHTYGVQHPWAGGLMSCPQAAAGTAGIHWRCAGARDNDMCHDHRPASAVLSSAAAALWDTVQHWNDPHPASATTVQGHTTWCHARSARACHWQPLGLVAPTPGTPCCNQTWTAGRSRTAAAKSARRAPPNHYLPALSFAVTHSSHLCLVDGRWAPGSLFSSRCAQLAHGGCCSRCSSRQTASCWCKR